jgi:hypothetical protein
MKKKVWHAVFLSIATPILALALVPLCAQRSSLSSSQRCAATTYFLVLL